MTTESEAEGLPPVTILPPTEDPTISDEAPYGRKADGTPKAKPGRKPSPVGPSARVSDGASPRPTVGPSAPRKRAPSARKTKGGTDYSEGIAGILQMAAMPFALAGTKDLAFAADAVAIVNATPDVASALNELAQTQPAIAAALDKILAVGPYGILISALIPMFVQILANHKVMPIEMAKGLGAQTPEQLLGLVAPAE